MLFIALKPASEQAVAASFAALRRCLFDAPSFWSLASLQQGSTLQLPSYYPIVGGEAGNMYNAKQHRRQPHYLCSYNRLASSNRNSRLCLWLMNAFRNRDAMPLL